MVVVLLAPLGHPLLPCPSRAATTATTAAASSAQPQKARTVSTASTATAAAALVPAERMRTADTMQLR